MIERLAIYSRRRLFGRAAGVAACTLGHRTAVLAAQGSPVGGAAPIASEEVEFALSGGVTMRGQFDVPATGTPPYPAVLLLQGSGPTDRDEAFVEPDGTVRRPFALIARELNARGMAVFRFDKRGVCPVSQPCDPDVYATQSKPVLVADASLAYERMLANPLIDPDRTAALGHSEGTWLAPDLAERFPEIRALVLIGTGLGPMHVLTFSQVTLPLLGVAAYDADGDGAIAAGEIPFADPAEMTRFVARARVQGQVFLFRYAGDPTSPTPVGLNPKLDVDRDGRGDLLTELRPVYEAFLANIARPLPVVERYADPSIKSLAAPVFAQHETFDGNIYASYLTEPADVSLRTLLRIPSQTRILIVNGANDAKRRLLQRGSWGRRSMPRAFR